MKLYLAVTPDELELPLGVYDSAIELARIFGINAQGVPTSIFRNQWGLDRSAKFIKVEVNLKINPNTGEIQDCNDNE